jgi:hypothetical protein
MTSTPSANPSHRLHTLALTLGALVACVCGLLVVCAPALAVFTRPYVGQLTDTPTGANGSPAPFHGGGAIATDSRSPGRVWVGENTTELVDEFTTSDAFTAQLSGIGTGSLAYDDTSPGKLVGIDGGAEHEFVAVDNSTGLTAGDIYYAKPKVSGKYRGSVRRVNADGDPVGFTCLEDGSRPAYINENGELVGQPADPGSPELWEATNGAPIGGIAVDSGSAVSTGAGDIYVVVESYYLYPNTSNPRPLGVDQFSSEGCFLHEFTESGTPLEFFDKQDVYLDGIAVDPTTGDLLVETEKNNAGRKGPGVIQEFASSGEYLGQVTGEAESVPFGNFSEGIAVSGEGNVYVGVEEGEGETRKSVVDEFGAGAFFPGVVTGGVSGGRRVSEAESVAVLDGTVDDEGLGLEECRFEYVSEAGFKVNDVNAVQSVSVSGASGGTFALSFEGQSTGGEGKGDLVGPAEGTGEVFGVSNTVTGVVTGSGVFTVGEEISGAGIPSETTIVAVDGGVLVLSADAEVSGSKVELKAVSDRVSSVETSVGAFVAGEEVSGAGIPAGTRIVEVGRGASAGTLTLSADVTVPGSGVGLVAALPYDASGSVVQSALQSVLSVGAGNVAVSGGAGGPYTVEFTTHFANTAVPVLSGDSTGLLGAGASVSVANTTEGGDGWGHASTVECAGGAGAFKKGLENQAVEAEVKGLRPGTNYRDRLIAATDAGEHGGVIDGQEGSFAAAAPPVVEGVSVSGVSSTGADLGASIDPLGSDTTYRFEYLTVAEFTADGNGWVGPETPGSVPVPAGDVGAGDEFVSVSVQPVGLVAGTSYRFRVVAANAAGTATGPQTEGVFVTLPASVGGVLPDGRAYEMVTPPNKEDGEDLFGAPGSGAKGTGGESINYDLGYSSEDGDHFLLDTAVAFGPFPTSYGDSYVFSRTATGWTFRAGASSSLGVQSGAAVVFDPYDFSLVGFSDDIGHVADVAIDDFVGPVGGPYQDVASGSEVSGSATENPEMVGASTDLSNVIVQGLAHKLALCGGAQEALEKKLDERINGLYEWSAAKGCLALVDVKSESEGGGLLSKCGAVIGTGFGGTGVSAHGAVSADGSRVVFTAPDPTGSGTECWEGGATHTPQLYVRVGGQSTVKISEAEKGVKLGGENPEEPAVFVGASKDGSRVFFITKTELTKEAVTLKLHDVELYEYDSEPGEGEAKLTRVSHTETGLSEHGGGAEQVVAVSPDGSTVYYEASGRLTESAPEGKGSYLYRYDTLTRTTVYVAPSPGYPGLHEPQGTWYEKPVGVQVAGLLEVAPFYTTGDGGFLIFGSTQNITGYESAGKEELYRYDAGDQSVTCVSCNPNGSRPSFPAMFTRSAVNHDSPSGTPPRPISENGQYVFFDTREALVSQATNGNVDVYEWEDDGSGSCTEAAGCVSLISSGESSTNDYFLDSSPDGSNVFFGTHSKLVPEDNDEQGDLYDARIDGGFPPPSGTGPCEGDACDNPPGAPIDQTPASLTFNGPGNIPSTPLVVAKSKPKTKGVTCKKGDVKKKDKCVKQSKSKGKGKAKAKKTAVARRKMVAGRVRARVRGGK